MTETTQDESASTKTEGTIEVTSRKTDRTVQFEKNFGSTVEEALELYGEKVVFSNFRQQVIIKCQAKVRQLLDKGGSVEDAVTAGENYVPGIITRAKVAKDPIQDLARKVASGELSQEDLIAQLEAQVASLEEEGE